MPQRKICIDRVLLCSNNLDTNLTKATNTMKSYKKVLAPQTTKIVVKSGSNPSKSTIIQGKIKIKNDFIASIKSKTLEAKEDNKEKYKIKPQPKQTRVVGERVTIVIRNQKPEKKGRELVDNFQYYESKNISKNNKESFVVHKRKENPYYQTITSQRNSKYTIGQRSGTILGKNENKINTIETRTQRNQYQNKTYNTTNITKTTKERGNINRNTNPNNGESSYQRTINVIEKRKNIPNKIHFEKTYIKTNKRKTTNMGQNINAHIYYYSVQNYKITKDIEKNKINLDQNKFQPKKEEIQKTSISQDQNVIKEETGNFLCPNCGYELFGASSKVCLEKWISRENIGIKRFIFYGKDNGFGGDNEYYWYGKMEKKHHGSYTDSGTSCGVKRNIHISSWTESVFKKNDSIESCWKEAFTDKKWNENLGKLSCLFCDYKSNFIDFIRAKKRQAKQ